MALLWKVYGIAILCCITLLSQQSHAFTGTSVRPLVNKHAIGITIKFQRPSTLLSIGNVTPRASLNPISQESPPILRSKCISIVSNVGTKMTTALKSKSKDFSIQKVISKSMVMFCTIALMQLLVYAPPASAKAAVAVKEHLHLGQKIANFFRSFGIPDLGVLAIISALPVVELRGAIPVGIWMGLPITTVFPVCVLGNMIPILPILLLLRNKYLTKLMNPILKRAETKTAELGIGSKKKQWVSLAAFVGIPLPGTGAWTGAMGAFLLDMPVLAAMSSIFAGVFAAGVIMSAITLAGKTGGIAALAALFILTGIELLKGEKSKTS